MMKPFSILSALLLLLMAQTEASPEIDAQIASIQTNFGVRIHYQYDPYIYFPPDWLHKDLSMEAEEIAAEEVTRLLPLINQFLEKHPESVLRADLENIYLLRSLSFRGKPYGGTHQGKSMYIISDGVANQYDDAFMLRRLHSEFSSILLTRHVFPTNSWVQYNPAGFSYSGTGFEMVDNPSRYDSTERSCSEGFLINYCRSSVQNDFNILSAWLFSRKDELDTLAQQHTRLRQKKLIAEQFYTTLSSEYTFD